MPSSFIRSSRNWWITFSLIPFGRLFSASEFEYLLHWIHFLLFCLTPLLISNYPYKPMSCSGVSFYGPFISSQLKGLPWPIMLRRQHRTNIDKGHWNTEIQSPYIPWNNSALEKHPTAEPGIYHATLWSISNFHCAKRPKLNAS